MNKPNFLIFGERRSGSTTLARWVECHPDVFLHPKMDMAYFIDKDLVGRKEWKEGKAEYAKWENEHSQTEYQQYFDNSENKTAIGEKSADYFFWQPAHERVKKYLPDVKLVITLRNPIDRAWSMYWNERGKGREILEFEDAINVEPERVLKSDYAKLHLSYVSRGYYDESLNALYKTFSRKNVYVLILEKARIDPKKYLKEIYTFIGVNDSVGYDNIKKEFNKNWTLIQKPTIKKFKVFASLENIIFRWISLFSFAVFRSNIYKRRKLISVLASPFRNSKSNFKMEAASREKLRKEYSPHIKNLEKILNTDLSIWLRD